MQITPTPDTNNTEPDQDTGAFETNDHPLEEGQDQIVIVLDLRREDPSNPDGSPAPDLARVLSGGSPEAASNLSFLLDGICETFDMDSSLSRINIGKVVDFEPGTGSATLDEFREIANSINQPDGGSPEDASEQVTEVATEQPIELGAGDNEDESQGVEPTEQTVEDQTEPTEPPSEPTPEVIEDVPHDAGAENTSNVEEG